MKKYLLIIFLFIGCTDNVPDNLISKEKMEKIIFDIMILNASSGFAMLKYIHNSAQAFISKPLFQLGTRLTMTNSFQLGILLTMKNAVSNQGPC